MNVNNQRQLLNLLEKSAQIQHDVCDIKMISGTQRQGTGVFRVTFDQGLEKYVRVLTEERAKNLRATRHASSKYGFPEYVVLDTQPQLLVMSPASGLPLSRRMPLSLLPIIWRFQSADLGDAMERLGMYLGRLHQDHVTGSTRLDQTKEYKQFYDLSDYIEEYLDGIDSTFLDLLEQQGSTRFVSSRLHSDPTPHNLFYHKSDVTLIDFSLRKGPVAVDVVRAERGISLMVDRLPYTHQKHKEQLIQRFRHGHSAEFNKKVRGDSYLLFQCTMDCYLLDRYLTKNSNKRGAMLARRTDPRILKSRISSAIKTISN